MQVLSIAAKGEPRALREMASRSHEAAEGRRDVAALICLAEALTFSRLAAAGGCKKAAGNTIAILRDLSALLREMGELEQSAAFARQGALVEARS
jgi:hypothetical protein